MAKKINSKHGLDNKQEIQARRVRTKLEQSDKEILSKYHSLWTEWMKSPSCNFESYLKNKDMVYYSAYVRVCQIKGCHVVFNEIANQE